MINKIYTLLFLLGLLMLIIPYINILYSEKSQLHSNITKKSIFIILSIILLITSWILREYNAHEKYFNDYNYASQNGLLVGGTVYTKFPENIPGLGWIL